MLLGSGWSRCCESARSKDGGIVVDIPLVIDVVLCLPIGVRVRVYHTTAEALNEFHDSLPGKDTVYAADLVMSPQSNFRTRTLLRDFNKFPNGDVKHPLTSAGSTCAESPVGDVSTVLNRVPGRNVGHPRVRPPA